jgi:hypothetical protein
MAWKKGQSGNPAGSQPGFNRRQSVGDMFIFRASKSGNALVFFREVMNSEAVPLGLRLMAGGYLAPYEHAKCTDPPIAVEVPLIKPKSVADAEMNISLINHYESTKRIGHASAAALRQGQKDWIEANFLSTIQISAKAALRAMEGGELQPKLIVNSAVADLDVGPDNEPINMPGREPEPPDTNPWKDQDK